MDDLTLILLRRNTGLRLGRRVGMDSRRAIPASGGCMRIPPPDWRGHPGQGVVTGSHHPWLLGFGRNLPGTDSGVQRARRSPRRRDAASDPCRHGERFHALMQCLKCDGTVRDAPSSTVGKAFAIRYADWMAPKLLTQIRSRHSGMGAYISGAFGLPRLVFLTFRERT
jgi:hypothetical protein